MGTPTTPASSNASRAAASLVVSPVSKCPFGMPQHPVLFPESAAHHIHRLHAPCDSRWRRLEIAVGAGRRDFTPVGRRDTSIVCIVGSSLRRTGNRLRLGFARSVLGRDIAELNRKSPEICLNRPTTGRTANAPPLVDDRHGQAFVHGSILHMSRMVGGYANRIAVLARAFAATSSRSRRRCSQRNEQVAGACRDRTDRALHRGRIARQHIVSGSGGSVRCQRRFNQWSAYFAGGL